MISGRLVVVRSDFECKGQLGKFTRDWNVF